MMRDRFTWLAYGLIAYYAFLEGGISSVMNFLSVELDLSYTLRAAHLSAFAFGLLLASLLTDRAVARFGRRAVFWSSGAGMAVCAVLLTLGRTAPLTLAALFGMALIGSFLRVLVQSTLSDRHGARFATIIAEANVAAVLLAAAAPLVISQAEGAGIVGWRIVPLLAAGAFALLALLGWREPIPGEVGTDGINAVRTPSSPVRTSPRTASHNAPFPPTFWLYTIVIFFSVAAEWSIIFWSGAFLEQTVGLAKTDATAMLSVFLGAMVIGRFTGSRLAAQGDLARLLIVSLVLALFGFSLYWLAPVPALNIAGLFLAGLGIANTFPFTLAAAMACVAGASDRASGRATLAASIAVLLMPGALGMLADSIGLQSAVGITGVFLIGAFSVALVAAFGRR
jgi:predicted MFS family arabinose efflux permease